MVPKKIVSAIVVVCGVVLLVAGAYVSYRVKAIKGQLGGVQKVSGVTSKVSKVPGIGSATSKATKPVTGKLDAAGNMIERYATIAQWVEIGGVILIIVGGYVYYVARKEGSV